jgi:hypothetical protein
VVAPLCLFDKSAGLTRLIDRLLAFLQSVEDPTDDISVPFLLLSFLGERLFEPAPRLFPLVVNVGARQYDLFEAS